MKRLTLALIFAAGPIALSACAGKDSGAASTAVTLTTDNDKTLYALGLIVGKNIGGFNLTPAELNIVKSGITDQVTGKKTQVEVETWGPKVGALNKERQKARAEIEKGKSKEFVANAAKEAGATLLPSGMVFKTLTPGNGPQPLPTDRVKVHYNGTLTDGTVFDSSIKRGQPAEFALNGVIPCWTEGVQRMKVGEKAKLVCPSAIAYGDNGRPPTIPGGATLIFEVELLGIEKPAAPGTAAPPMQLNLGGGAHPPGLTVNGMPQGGMPPGHGMMPLGGMPPGPRAMPGMAPGHIPPTGIAAPHLTPPPATK